mgnify:CR=1 FL=1
MTWTTTTRTALALALVLVGAALPQDGLSSRDLHPFDEGHEGREQFVVRHRVARAQLRLDAARDLAQDVVAARMSMRVVDALEPTPAGLAHGLGRLLVEEREHAVAAQLLGPVQGQVGPADADAGQPAPDAAAREGDAGAKAADAKPPDRLKVVDFVIYSNTSVCMFGLAANPRFAQAKSVDDLNRADITISYYTGGGEEGWVKERFPKAQLRGVAGSGTAPVEEVMAKRADAVPINRVPWVAMGRKLKQLAVLPKENSCQDSTEKAQPVGLAINKGQDAYGEVAGLRHVSSHELHAALLELEQEGSVPAQAVQLGDHEGGPGDLGRRHRGRGEPTKRAGRIEHAR